MPGRGRRGGGSPDLTGFESQQHGQRAELEEVAGAAAGGGMVPDIEGGGVPPDAPEMMGGGGMAPGAGLPFENPMFGADGSIVPGGVQAPRIEPFPDDPDLVLRVLMKAFPHPDIARLLEDRANPVLYPRSAPQRDMGDADFDLDGDIGEHDDLMLEGDPMVDGDPMALGGGGGIDPMMADPNMPPDGHVGEPMVDPGLEEEGLV